MNLETARGPQVPPLLTLPHISDRLWEQHDTTSLSCRRADTGFWDRPIDPRVLHCLMRAGFYGVARIGFIKLDHPLITALVERWRQETHTFHFPTGESTVTLQDVSVLFGLPVDGSPITGVDHARSPAIWAQECQRLLGRSPEEGHIEGGRLRMRWLTTHFGELPENALEETVQSYARAYILRLIGGFLMPGKSRGLVKLSFLQFLADFDSCGKYSWGGAVLASLYRMLCRASRPGCKEIGGPLVLLQIWAWERLPRIAPRRLQDVGPGQDPIQEGEQQLPGGPWGSRWRVDFALDQVPTHVVAVYRDQFDRLTLDEFIWDPYGDQVMEVLPGYCAAGSDIWMSHVPLICFELVEWHLPQRVLRQFGCVQGIPDHFETDQRLHNIDKRGHRHTDWVREHARFITLWEARRDQIVPADRTDRVLEYQDPYMQWFRSHTRLLIGNPSHQASSGYQDTGGVVEVLTQCTVDSSEMADKIEKAMRAGADPETILRAIATLRDNCNNALRQVHRQDRLTYQPLRIQPSTPAGQCEDPANVPAHTSHLFRSPLEETLHAAFGQPIGDIHSSHAPSLVSHAISPTRGTLDSQFETQTPAQIPISWPADSILNPSWVIQLMEAFDWGSRNLAPSEFPSLFPVEVFDNMVLSASKILHKEPNCVEVEGCGADSSIVVVGDIKGQLHDMIFLLRDAGFPTDNRIFVFNGDYVDRGAWGLETFLLLLAWKVCMPHKVFLLRGNHETKYCTSVYGFEKEVLKKYGDMGKHVYQTCLDCFQGLPLASIIARCVYTAHGGLFRSMATPSLKRRKGENTSTGIPNPVANSLVLGSLEELSKAGRKLLDPPWEGHNLIPADVLWSDPSMSLGISPNEERGNGILWGPDCTEEFLTKFNLKLIIRSHEGPDAREKRPGLGRMNEGYTIDHVVESGKLITLFSAPDYPQFQSTEERYNNKGAYIVLEPPHFDSPVFHSFEAVTPRPKANAYYDYKKEELDSESMVSSSS